MRVGSHLPTRRHPITHHSSATIPSHFIACLPAVRFYLVLSFHPSQSPAATSGLHSAPSSVQRPPGVQRCHERLLEAQWLRPSHLPPTHHGSPDAAPAFPLRGSTLTPSHCRTSGRPKVPLVTTWTSYARTLRSALVVSTRKQARLCKTRIFSLSSRPVPTARYWARCRDLLINHQPPFFTGRRTAHLDVSRRGQT